MRNINTTARFAASHFAARRAASLDAAIEASQAAWQESGDIARRLLEISWSSHLESQRWDYLKEELDAFSAEKAEFERRYAALRAAELLAEREIAYLSL